MSQNFEKATLGGGCFWCLEAVYQRVRGVREVNSGYAGGHTDNPNYEAVCSGSTGHAEVVQIIFDPTQIRYRDILEIFWHIHDPTTLNRQGNDIGSQYRSVIFYDGAAQKAEAEQTLAELSRSGVWPDAIVTEIEPLRQFYPAEEYHQNYYRTHPNQSYCQLVISPKLQKFMENFKDRVV